MPRRATVFPEPPTRRDSGNATRLFCSARRSAAQPASTPTLELPCPLCTDSSPFYVPRPPLLFCISTAPAFYAALAFSSASRHVLHRLESLASPDASWSASYAKQSRAYAILHAIDLFEPPFATSSVLFDTSERPHNSPPCTFRGH